MGKRVEMVRIRNPYGNQNEWKGAWSDNSNEWKLLECDEFESSGLTFSNDGES